MTFTDEQVAALREPLDRSTIATREGPSNRTLSYLPAWQVIKSLNTIFGHGAWQYRVMDLQLIGEEELSRPATEWHPTERGRRVPKLNDQGEQIMEEGWRCAYRTLCELSVGDAVYQDVGFGEDVSYDSVLKIHELAVKEAVSDALKRCARNLGDQFGLALWDKESEENAEATGGRRRGGGGGGNTQKNTEPRKLSDTVRKRILATCSEHDIDDDLRHRVTRLITGGRTHSLAECTTADAQALIRDFKAFIEVPREDAMAQLEAWESEHPAEVPA